jgi:cell division control protein 6
LKLRKSVFKDEAKLDINYVPRRLPHREKELRLLMQFFDFLLRFPDRMTQRVIITGNVGTGKTVLAQRFGAEITLEANKRNLHVNYLHVNCREYRGSLFLTLQHAITTFRPNFPKRGYSAEELLVTLLQCLDEENKFLILALDEFDSLLDHEGSEAIYKLTRVQETRQGKPQRLSLISILRDITVLDRLDESARSTLQRNIISLDKYVKTQLVDILNERLSMAFNPYTVPADTVALIADLAESESGNARFAIELLWRAGKYADAEELDEVVAECVRKAVASIIPSLRKSELASLGLHEKLLLLGAARVFKDSKKAYATLMEVEVTYAIVCEEFDEKPSSHIQVWKYTQRLSSLGILRTEVVSANVRGRQTHVSLPSIPAVELEKDLCTSLEKELR